MHSKIIALAVAGSSASAFVVPRDDGCTFGITASGGKSGTVGQLGDGQNRIGGGLAPASYHTKSNASRSLRNALKLLNATSKISTFVVSCKPAEMQIRS